MRVVRQRKVSRLDHSAENSNEDTPPDRHLRFHKLPTPTTRLSEPKQQKESPIAFVGDFRWSADSQAERNGWLKCDGRLLAIQKYPTLFSVIGTIYGGKEGYFNLPNPTDQVIGVSGEKYPQGTSKGEETHALTVAEMPSHTHSGTTNSSGTHNHGGCTGEGGVAPYSTIVSTASCGATVAGSGKHTHAINNDGNHVHTFSTGPSGQGQPHGIMQPTLFLGSLYIYAGD